MRKRRGHVGGILLLGVALTVGGLPAAGNTSSDSEITVLTDSPESRAPEIPLASGALRQLVDDVNNGRVPSEGLDLEGERVRVEILHELSQDAVEDLVGDLDGVIEGGLEGLTQALVPVGQLVALEGHEGIVFVRPPLRVDIPVTLLAPSHDSSEIELQALVTGEEVAKTNADAWHTAGITGEGVKIGIVDLFSKEKWDAAQTAGEVPSPAGTYLCANGTCATSFPDVPNATHGVLVAEVIHEMAPSAQIFIASAVTISDLQAVVDYFDSQGVHIISRSLTSEYDGPGDGTGPIAEVVDDAVSKGMLWVNSAGNNAGAEGVRDGSYWRGSWVDENDNGWLDWSPGDELLAVSCEAGLLNGLRWSDWAEDGRTDYDLYVFDTVADAGSLNPEASSQDRQGDGALPLEILESGFPCDTGFGTDYVAVYLFSAGSGAEGDVIELMGNRMFFEHWSNPYSASGPAADTASVGAFAVGAVDPPDDTKIAPYSSWGPTNDGRIKPDISAASCVENFTSTECFNGTSAAAPVVSGAAALVLESGEASSPSAVKSYLLNNATVDRGASGSDNVFGKGELILPDPPGDFLAPTWPDLTFRADVFERTLTLEWKAAQDGVGVAGYIVVQAPGTPIDGVFHGTVIAELGASARSYQVSGLVPGTSYAFWVEAFDAAGNVSTDGPLRVFTTATDFGDTNGHIFHDDIAWLAGAGITFGCNPPDNTMFCPDDAVSREQMASFLVRALGLTGGEGSNFFTDDDNSVHETNIDRLAFWEITFGCNPTSVPPNTLFCPGDPVTRAQMASFLVRALLLIDGWNIDYFQDDDFSIHEFDINRLAHSEITKGCNPPLNTLFCPSKSVTRGQMAAFLHRASDHINAIRDLLQLPLLGVKNDAASNFVATSTSP